LKTVTVGMFFVGLVGLLFDPTRLLGIACIALLLAFYPIAAFVLLPLVLTLLYVLRHI